MQIMALWLLIRPRTLPLTLGVVLAAHALAAAMGAFAWLPFALSLLTVLLLQILSNIANDYGDALRGTDTNRSENAPTRAVASGQLGKWRGVAAGVFAWLARLAGVFAAGRAGDCDGVGVHLGAATVWLSRFGRSGGVFEFWLAGRVRQCVFANAHAACPRVAARRRKWITGSKCVAYQQYTRFIQRLGSGQTHVGK